MCITINVKESCTDIPDCMTAEDVKLATVENKHLDILSKYALHCWPSPKGGNRRNYRYVGMVLEIRL